jgi:hypothetical protein
MTRPRIRTSSAPNPDLNKWHSPRTPWTSWMSLRLTITLTDSFSRFYPQENCIAQCVEYDSQTIQHLVIP